MRYCVTDREGDLMKRLLVLIPLSLLLMGFACQQQDLMKTAQSARDGLAVSKGVLDTAHAKYDAQCKLDAMQAPCPLIHNATAVQNTTVDALNLYCQNTPAAGVPSYEAGGECKPDASLAPKLQAATNDLNTVISDVKGVVK
jgi:hypothetical protein